MSFEAVPNRVALVRDGVLREGPHLARARTQAAVVRALLDQLERCGGTTTAENEVRFQLSEEMGRLRCQMGESTVK